VEDDRIVLAKDILERAAQRGLDFQLPVDVVVAAELSPKAGSRVVDRENIPADMFGVDIGPGTLELFAQRISDAKTVVWNGPMGVFEIESFAKGTYGIARALAELTDAGGLTIVGGGDSAAAVASGGYEERISHISTGGGASLEFLAGRSLPGVEVLTEKG
jgi:3-phosphoglycerate kinase